MMMFSAPCTVLNAIPACVTTPNSTSPAKYLGAMMRLGSANVANSYALVNSARLRLHAIFLRSTDATMVRNPRAAAASRLAPPYSAMDSACSLARTKPNLKSASLRSAWKWRPMSLLPKSLVVTIVPKSEYPKQKISSVGEMLQRTPKKAPMLSSFCATASSSPLQLCT